jgi:hypothetical protein
LSGDLLASLRNHRVRNAGFRQIFNGRPGRGYPWRITGQEIPGACILISFALASVIHDFLKDKAHGSPLKLLFNMPMRQALFAMLFPNS